MPWFRWHSDARTRTRLAALSSKDPFWCYHNLLCYAAEQPRRWYVDTSKPHVLAVDVSGGDEALLQRTLDLALDYGLLERVDEQTVLCAEGQRDQYDYASDMPDATRERKRVERTTRTGGRIVLSRIVTSNPRDTGLSGTDGFLEHVTSSHELSRASHDGEVERGEVERPPTATKTNLVTPPFPPTNTRPQAARAHETALALPPDAQVMLAGFDTIFGPLIGPWNSERAQQMRVMHCRRAAKAGITLDDMSEYIQRTGLLLNGKGYGEAEVIDAIVAERNASVRRAPTHRQGTVDMIEEVRALQDQMGGAYARGTFTLASDADTEGVGEQRLPQREIYRVSGSVSS